MYMRDQNDTRLISRPAKMLRALKNCLVCSDCHEWDGAIQTLSITRNN